MARVTRIRHTPGGRDEYADPVSGSTSTTELRGCLLAPDPTAVQDDRARDGFVARQVLYAPAGTDLLHTDQVGIDGVPWDIEGQPEDWSRPGRRAGIVARLKRAVG